MTIMEKRRCKWAENVEEIYVKYHDEEWGRPVFDDHKLFEMLVLESFQAGLSWITILKKREAFRQAFDDFQVEKVADYQNNKIEFLMGNKNIVRNRRKIQATIQNAQIFMKIQQEYGSFANYIWSFTDHKVQYLNHGSPKTSSELSDRISHDLRKRGMRFVGTIIIYSYLQAVGIVQDHEEACYLHNKEFI